MRLCCCAMLNASKLPCLMVLRLGLQTLRRLFDTTWFLCCSHPRLGWIVFVLDCDRTKQRFFGCIVQSTVGSHSAHSLLPEFDVRPRMRSHKTKLLQCVFTAGTQSIRCFPKFRIRVGLNCVEAMRNLYAGCGKACMVTTHFSVLPDRVTPSAPVPSHTTMWFQYHIADLCHKILFLLFLYAAQE
jgi:hypothetical protein